MLSAECCSTLISHLSKIQAVPARISRAARKTARFCFPSREDARPPHYTTDARLRERKGNRGGERDFYCKRAVLTVRMRVNGGKGMRMVVERKVLFFRFVFKIVLFYGER